MEDQDLVIAPAGLVADDIDPDGDALRLVAVDGTVGGTARLDPDGSRADPG
jgi:hypothetical protein